MCPTLALDSTQYCTAPAQISHTAVRHVGKTKNHDLLSFPPFNVPPWGTDLETLVYYIIQLKKWENRFLKHIYI